MNKTRHSGIKAFFDFLLSSRGNTGERASVKGVDRRDNFVFSLLMAEFTRELE